MNRICVCREEGCFGEVNRYKIYSSSDDKHYPNRFWGVSDYCEKHKMEELSI